MFTKGHSHGKRFKKGQEAWNKGKKMVLTEKAKLANKNKKGKSLSKPPNFSETMRKVNPPLGIKKKFDWRDREKKLKVWRDGYIFLYRPDHQSSRKKPPDYGYILEHRMVMEEMLGRQIVTGEVIHHLDGNKSNNNKDNLLLCEAPREHNRVHTRMEVFVEKLIREGKVYYDREEKEFKFR